MRRHMRRPQWPESAREAPGRQSHEHEIVAVHERVRIFLAKQAAQLCGVASRLARPPRTALAAPESATSTPRGWAANLIHNLRAEPRCFTGANAVPTSSPMSAGPALRAAVSTAGMPETAAMRAASSFVTIPPVPTPDSEPPTRT